MRFQDVLGLHHLKEHLKLSIHNNRVPHAQLFVGNVGSGTLPMAIAFANELIVSGLTPDVSTSSLSYINQLTHPDLHFVYPINTTATSPKNPVSADFIKEWRTFVFENPYQSLYDWFQYLGIETKQGIINKDEAVHIMNTLSLKSFAGGYKVMIVWCADKMNATASNKLLKLIEEPPSNTYFVLVTESPEDILQTIRSRCQRLDFPPMGQHDLVKGLVSRLQLDEQHALKIAHQADGSFTKALQLADQNTDDKQFEQWFITWVRSAFRAKGNKHVVIDLLDWSENLASESKETQKRFLNYCIHFFRQALLNNYEAKDLVFLSPYDPHFKFDKFSEFITGKNIQLIFKVLEDAVYYVERNGNSKMIFSDLSMQLTRYLHQK